MIIVLSYNVIFLLVLIMCHVDQPSYVTITPPMTTTVGAVFKCVVESASPPVNRYEWHYGTAIHGHTVYTQLNGSSDTWALTGQVLYG